MSKLATTWLESNFRLSRPINSLDRDASNGYILLSVVHQCGYLTDDEFEHAKDDAQPTTAIENATLLAKALSSAGITLTQSDIAEIVSEHPGAAAKVIIAIKENLSAKSSTKANRKTVKKAAPGSSLKGFDKEYLASRDTIKKFEANRPVENHLEANLAKFKMFDLSENERDKSKQLTKTLENINRRDKIRDQLIEKSHLIMQNHQSSTQKLVAEWGKTQKVRHSAELRDLQYELANNQKKELSKTKKAFTEKIDVMKSLGEFDSKFLNDDAEVLMALPVFDTETSENFNARLLEQVKGTQYEEETKKFMSSLKTKMSANRNNIAKPPSPSKLTDSLSPSKFSMSSIGDQRKEPVVAYPPLDDDDDSVEETEESEMDHRRAYQEAMKKIFEVAEVKIEEFSEAVKAREAKTGERAKEFAMVQNAQLERQKAKAMTNAISEGENARSDSPSSPSKDDLQIVKLDDIAMAYYEHPLELSIALQQACLNLDFKDVYLRNVLLSEIWPVFRCLGANVGQWVISDESVPESYAAHSPSILQICERHIGEALLELLPSSDINERKLCDSYPALALGADELNSFKNRKCPVIVGISYPCQHDFMDLTSIIESLSRWCGNGLLSWDSVRAMKHALLLKKALEEQSEGLTFNALMRCVGDDSWQCNDEVIATLSISLQALRVALEVSDIANRVLASVSIMNPTVPSKKKTGVSLPVSTATLSILASQTLWLRLYVTESLQTALPSFLNPDICILFNMQPNFSRLVSTSLDRSDSVNIRLIDWFLRGNKRENVPKDDTELASAIDSDPIGKINMKKIKGKAIPDDVQSETTLISSVIMLQLPTSAALAPTDPTALYASYVVGDDSRTVASDTIEYQLLQCEAVFLLLLSSKPIESTKQASSARGKPKQSFIEPATISAPLLAINFTTDCKSIEFDANINISTPLELAEIFLCANVSCSRDSPDLNSDINKESTTENVVSNTALLSINKTFLEQVICVRDQRRLLLSPPEKLCFNHSIGTHVLNSERLAASFNNIQTLLSESQTFFGMQALCVELVLKQATFNILNEEKTLKGVSAATVEKTKSLCVSAANQLDKKITIQPVFVEEISCALGDIVDAQHMKVLATVSKFKSSILETVSKAKTRLDAALKGFGVNILRLATQSMSIVEEMCSTFSAAGYSEVFPVASCLSRGQARKQIDRKRDNLRALIATIESARESNVNDESILYEWKELLVLGTNLKATQGADHMLYASVSTVLCNALSQASSLLTAIIAAHEALVRVKESSDKCAEEDVHKEHEDAHAQLSRWIVQLKERLKLSKVDAVSYLVNNAFAVQIMAERNLDVVWPISVIEQIAKDILSPDRIRQCLLDVLKLSPSEEQLTLGEVAKRIIATSVQRHTPQLEEKYILELDKVTSLSSTESRAIAKNAMIMKECSEEEVKVPEAESELVDVLGAQRDIDVDSMSSSVLSLLQACLIDLASRTLSDPLPFSKIAKFGSLIVHEKQPSSQWNLQSIRLDLEDFSSITAAALLDDSLERCAPLENLKSYLNVLGMCCVGSQGVIDCEKALMSLARAASEFPVSLRPKLLFATSFNNLDQSIGRQFSASATEFDVCRQMIVASKLVLPNGSQNSKYPQNLPVITQEQIKTLDKYVPGIYEKLKFLQGEVRIISTEFVKDPVVNVQEDGDENASVSSEVKPLEIGKKIVAERVTNATLHDAFCVFWLRKVQSD